VGQNSAAARADQKHHGSALNNNYLISLAFAVHQRQQQTHLLIVSAHKARSTGPPGLASRMGSLTSIQPRTNRWSQPNATMPEIAVATLVRCWSPACHPAWRPHQQRLLKNRTACEQVRPASAWQPSPAGLKQ
jgi:hypothetical protein